MIIPRNFRTFTIIKFDNSTTPSRSNVPELIIFFHTERAEDSDTTPVVVKISQQDERERLPDFGGHSPIRVDEEEERRPHGKA